ncbi:AAA family ATPase, partial [Ornithobacterium rhinotracheale]
QKKNAFYIDCSQAKTKQLFIRLLAKTIGVDSTGRYADVKNTLKTYLAYLEKPLIVLDEAGDLDYTAFLELKELWNATQGHCGWYMIGADGLRA